INANFQEVYAGLETKYTMPGTGLPAAALDPAVQAILTSALRTRSVGGQPELTVEAALACARSGIAAYENAVHSSRGKSLQRWKSTGWDMTTILNEWAMDMWASNGGTSNPDTTDLNPGFVGEFADGDEFRCNLTMPPGMVIKSISGALLPFSDR